MKKLLLLFLFLGGMASAQINTQVTALQVCDTNNDGMANFDLTAKIPEILNNLDPGMHTVTFHETLTDSQTGTMAIPNASNFLNQNPWNQAIYVRVVNTQNSAVSFTSFSIVVNPVPVVNNATQFWCDPFELPMFDLSASNNQITGGVAGLTVSYFSTEADAVNNVNPLPQVIPPATQPVQIVFARVQNNATGCFSITTLTLNTNNCIPTCEAPANVTVSAVTSNSAVISWTSPGGPLCQVLVLPFGSPAPTAATQGWVYVQTNPYTIIGLDIDTCYTAYVRAFCPNTNATVSPWSAGTSFCMHDCTNNAQCPESLALIAFLDTNNNGTKDNGEPDFIQGNYVYDINDSGNPVYASSNNGSFYIFENDPGNSYDISYAVNPSVAAYFSSSATYANVTAPAGSGSSAYYFPITQLQPYNDLEVYIVPMGNPRPGFIYHNMVYYKNKGYQTVSSGTVAFTKSPIVSITAISQGGTIATPTGFTYNFANLGPNEMRSIQVSMQVPTIPTVNLGDIVTNSAAIEPLAGDAFPANNAAYLSQTIVGSYDPNDKMEAHGPRILFDDFTANDYLTYTIRFENTGTASADFIRIEDTLEGGLNAASVIALDASHPVDVRRIGNKLIWNFYDINLPPTVSSPALSHGYVRFKVKPTAGFNVGTLINNRAEIYFDYNPPIITNLFETEFVDVMDVVDFGTTDFAIIPNPAHSVFGLQLQNPNETIRSIALYNVLGRQVKKIETHATGITVDVSDLSKGIYLVEILTESQSRLTKKLIIR